MSSKPRMLPDHASGRQTHWHNKPIAEVRDEIEDTLLKQERERLGGKYFAKTKARHSWQFEFLTVSQTPQSAPHMTGMIGISLGDVTGVDSEVTLQSHCS